MDGDAQLVSPSLSHLERFVLSADVVRCSTQDMFSERQNAGPGGFSYSGGL